MKRILWTAMLVPLGAGLLLGQDPPVRPPGVPPRPVAPPAPAPTPAPGDPQDGSKVQLNSITLQQLLESVQKRTKKTFVYDDLVGQQFAQKKVRVFASRDFGSPEELFAIFQSVLEVQDFALIRVGEGDKEVYKVQPSGKARMKAPVDGAGREPNDSYVTRVFTLKHVSPQDVFQALMNIAAPQSVIPVQNAGMLIVTDFDYNIRRYEQIIESIDKQKPDMVTKMIPLRKAIASDVETMLNNLLTAIVAQQKARPGMPGIPGQEQAKVVADKRTNSLLILAEPGRMEQVESLVRQLDGEAEFESSGIYLVHLKHTDAVDMSRTVNALYNIGVDQNGIPTGGSSGSIKPNQPVGPGGAPTTGGSAQSPGGVGGGEPKIVADKRTNSLMIVTDRNTYLQLLKLVERLDRRRPQVLIKATVVEVRSKDTFDLGIELGAANEPNGVTPLGHTGFGYSTFVPDPSGKFFNIVPVDTPGLTFALVKDRIGNLGVLLKALKDKASIQILDEPEVATVDNGAADIKLSTDVPVTQVSVTGTGIAQETFSGFQSAVTTLSISPHISEGNYLRLETNVKIEKFSGTSADRRIPPAKTSREINAKPIMVPNAHTIVIGGIVTTDRTDVETSVPFLGEIPILGNFFKRSRQEEEKRTLYIFITPYILYDESFADLKDLTRDRHLAVQGIRNQAIRNLQIEGQGDPTPASSYRYVRPVADRPRKPLED